MDLDGVKEFILGLILVALIGAAGAIALGDFRDQQKASDTTLGINETRTTGSGLEQGGVMFVSVSSCINASGDPVLLGVHCNVSASGVVLNPGNFSGGNAYINYTYYTPSAHYNISGNGLLGVNNATGYFGTAGTIVGVALLLTIVIGAFYFITKRRE